MDKLQLHIEAILFSAQQSVSPAEIADCLNRQYGLKMSEADIFGHIDDIAEKYAGGRFAIELVPIGEGFRFLSRSEYHPSISAYLNLNARRRLSRSAMETLSIIAYKQPVSKAEIEQIRGVNCDYSIQKLLERELIAIEGRSDAPGRPILYGVSQFFLDYFGINSIKDLPQLKDIRQEVNEIGLPDDGAEVAN